MSEEEPTSADKPAKGDEQGLTLTGTPELSDPAILAVNPKFRYSKDQLLKLRNAPFSQVKPSLNVTDMPANIFDPVKWNTDRKKSDTPSENGTRAVEEHRRRNGDPRERLRKEQDGIVLSPQRRSFNSGCCVQPSKTTATTNRPHSPLGGGGKPDLGGGIREVPSSSSRRIGSGRILKVVAWDFSEKPEGNDAEYNYRGGQERRFGREFDGGRDKEKERRRFGERRRIGGENRDEEPEWFSSGPVSQNETIELRGFDESERFSNNNKKKSSAHMKRARDWSKKKSEVTSLNEEKEEIEGRSTPTPQVGEGEKEAEEKNTKTENVEKRSDEAGGKQEKTFNDQSYIFEDILKSDSIPGLPGLLANGVGTDSDNAAGKSRFSKWFTMENNADSRRSSIQDEAMIKNLLKDLNEPSVSIPPGDSNTYFAPISPAANTGTGNASTGNGKSVNIMDMLQKGKANEGGLKQQVPGRIMNLNEIEAKLRQTTDAQIHKPHKGDEDITAFNRLMANISAHHHNNPKSQPMSLMEMLSHSQQMDEAQARMNHLLSPGSDMSAARHKQQQMEMLSKLMNAGMSGLGASQQPEMGVQQSLELLSRPEAQAILQALHQRIPSPRELQVHTQNILQRALIKKKLEEQQENYRKKQEMQQRGQSPNNNTNNNNNTSTTQSKNVASPTQLAFTPTSVLRKMTAEKEDKEGAKLSDAAKQGRPVTGMRQQQQQPQSQQQQTQQQWSQFPMNVKQPGRPIVKANNYQPPQEFFNQQQQQQQKFLSQLQQQQHQQQRMTSFHPAAGGMHPKYNNQQFGQLTQQQLRAQHQQHARPAANVGGGGGQQQQQFGTGGWQQFLTPQQGRAPTGRAPSNDGDLSPTSNQLTRWFSPDLLERARVGELPSTTSVSQQLLSLEDIERLAAPPVHN